MPGYGSLERIADEATRTVLKQAFDQIQTLQRELAALRSAALIKASTTDAGGLRLSNLAPGTASSDAVTLNQVRALIDQVKKATY